MRLLQTPFLFLSLLALCACEPPKPSLPPPPPGSGKVLIVNEGNFQAGNASLSLYDPADHSLQQDVYAPANSNRPLGDVLQSASQLPDGRLWLVVNNSGKAEELNPQTWQSLGSITGLRSPRYLCAYNDSLAYATELYDGKLWHLNLHSRRLLGSVVLPGWTEEMALVGSRIWVANYHHPWLYALDPQTGVLTDSLPLPAPASALKLDAQGKLWALCAENPSASSARRLLRLDLASKTVLQNWPLANAATPPRLALNPAGDTLYYLSGSVFRLPISASAPPATPFFAAAGRLLYGLGVHPRNGEVYVADAIDYYQRGEVVRLSAEGLEIKRFKVGVIPNGFVFF